MQDLSAEEGRKFRRLVVLLIIVQVVVPIAIYVCYLPKLREQRLKIEIERYWNTEEARKALQYVESTDLNELLPESLGSHGVLFNNDTLKEYIRRAQETAERGDMLARVHYLANSTEGEVSLNVTVINETINAIVMFNGNVVLKVTSCKGVVIPLLVAINSSGYLGVPNENMSMELHGFFIKMKLSYSETCRYPSLCGHGETTHQYIVLDENKKVLLIYAMVTYIVV